MTVLIFRDASVGTQDRAVKYECVETTRRMNAGEGPVCDLTSEGGTPNSALRFLSVLRKTGGKNGATLAETRRLTQPVFTTQDLRSQDSLLDLNPRHWKRRFSLRVTRALISLGALTHSSRPCRTGTLAALSQDYKWRQLGNCTDETSICVVVNARVR